VGLDHSFYRPPSISQLAHYASQVPDDFHICPKAWEGITIPAYADHPRYGGKAGNPNPRFLDAAWCDEMVLRPVREGLGTRTGGVLPALDGQTPIYVLANNRAEGNAPATIQAIVDGLTPPE